jgi:hypothetical protein
MSSASTAGSGAENEVTLAVVVRCLAEIKEIMRLMQPLKDQMTTLETMVAK